VQQVLGWSALKTGLLHPDRQDGDPLGGGSQGPGERLPRAFTAGSQWAIWVTVGTSVVGLIATVALIPPEQLQHVEESAAVAWPPPRMSVWCWCRLLIKTRTRMFGTHAQQNT